MKMVYIPLYIAIIFIGLPLAVFGQQWNSRISLESRAGYATNSYLNDYLSEWEPSLSAPYWMLAPNVQLSRYFDRNVLSVYGGFYFQPYLSPDYSSWKGGFGHVDFNRRWNRSLFTGIKAGINRYHYKYTRTLTWLRPYVRWNISDDMEGQLQWSSSYRDYKGLKTDSSSNYYNRFAISYQWWPSYEWHLQTGIYGNIDQIGGGEKAFSGYVGTAYWFRNDLKVQLRGGFERYGFQTTSKRSVGPRCDVHDACSVNNRVFISNQDDIYRLKVSGEYSFNHRWTFNISGAVMKWQSNRSRIDGEATDMSFSMGVTYSISPDWGGREQVQAPVVKQTGKGKTLFRITYKGEAKLYLTGEFNNWKRPGIPLIKGPSHSYRTTLQVDPGVYEYKILKIEGGETEWLKLDNKAVMVKDGFGGMNGRMVIE